MDGNDKKYMILLFAIAYLVTMVFVIFLSQVAVVSAEYGDQYSLTTLPLNFSFDLIGSHIGVDLLIALPIALLICLIGYLVEKYGEKLPKIPEKYWFYPGIIALVYFISFIIFFAIHYYAIVIVEYGAVYNFDTLPLKIGLGIIGFIIGFDLLVSIPITAGVSIIGLVIINYLDKNED